MHYHPVLRQKLHLALMIPPSRTPQRSRLRHFAIALGLLAMGAVADDVKELDWVSTGETPEAERDAQCLR
ncbi:MAG TPA: hypothetical protein DEQ90_17915, partial [Halieaceae bacterium]|nr:hypothetical protein [Halieaceae bacterium]